MIEGIASRQACSASARVTVNAPSARSVSPPASPSTIAGTFAELARPSTSFIPDPVPAGLIPGDGTGLPWSLT